MFDSRNAQRQGIKEQGPRDQQSLVASWFRPTMPSPQQLPCLQDLHGVDIHQYKGKVLNFYWKSEDPFRDSYVARRLCYVSDVLDTPEGHALTIQRIRYRDDFGGLNEYKVLDNYPFVVYLKNTPPGPADESSVQVFDEAEFTRYKEAQCAAHLRVYTLREGVIVTVKITLILGGFLTVILFPDEIKDFLSRGRDDLPKNPGSVTREFVEHAETEKK